MELQYTMLWRHFMDDR